MATKLRSAADVPGMDTLPTASDHALAGSKPPIFQVSEKRVDMGLEWNSLVHAHFVSSGLDPDEVPYG
jgi:hypothetical protein